DTDIYIGYRHFGVIGGNFDKFATSKAEKDKNGNVIGFKSDPSTTTTLKNSFFGTHGVEEINMTTLANMSTTLNDVTVQDLLDYTEFTNGLVDKLAGKLAKLNGENATEAGVTAMLGKLTTDKVITTKALTAQLADKADKTALDGFAKLDGSNIDVGKFSGKLTTEGSSTIKTELAKKADSTALESKADKTGSNIEVEPFSNTLAAKLVKLDGTNATDAGVAAMLGKLQDKVVTTSKFTEETAKLANNDASDIDVDSIATKLESKFATTTKLTEETAKLAHKDASNIDVVQFSTRLTTEDTSAIKTALDGKANTSDLDNKADKTALNDFAKLDGTNAEQGAALLNAILNVKSSTDSKQTILEERLTKAGAVDVGQFVKLDGTNVATSVDKGKALAEAIFSVKDSGGSTTILVSELADKFAVAGSASGEKI
ncbi:Hypothetical protein CINCED_3A021213, partial [Cinara cedri]